MSIKHKILAIAVTLIAMAIIARCLFVLLNLQSDAAFYMGLLIALASVLYYPSIIISILRRK
jgi:uncharacterized membrane protein